MPPAYKNKAGVHVISPRHQIPDPLELTLLTIMTMMAVSGALASIRKDFIILTNLSSVCVDRGKQHRDNQGGQECWRRKGQNGRNDRR